MKKWWLVVAQYSYWPIPRRWQAGAADLPQALVFLPLWALLNGLLALAVAHVTRALGTAWAASVMVGFGLLLNGGIWLRDLMLVASGRRPPRQDNDQPVSVALPAKARLAQKNAVPQQQFNRASYAVACLYLCLQFVGFVLVLRRGLPLWIWPVAQVGAAWVYLWGVSDFAALPPAFLQRGYTRRAFKADSLITLLLLLPTAFFYPALWPALLVMLLAVLLFYQQRRRSLAALDEAAYGAAAAWAEVVLFLGFILFSAVIF